ncbi:hypothetical protein FRC02_010339, partial [Tulasnella sp. 418]
AGHDCLYETPDKIEPPEAHGIAETRRMTTSTSDGSMNQSLSQSSPTLSTSSALQSDSSSSANKHDLEAQTRGKRGRWTKNKRQPLTASNLVSDPSLSLQSPSSHFSFKATTGDLPRAEDHFTRSLLIDDGVPPTMFIFGGLVQGKASNNLFKVDMDCGVWTDLTNQVNKLKKYDQLGREIVANQDLRSNLPPRLDATSQIYKTKDGKRFLLVFGGSEPSTLSPQYSISTNSLIALDLDENSLTWNYVDTTVNILPRHDEDKTAVKQLKGVLPRSGSGSFIHEEKLFIFGGYRTFLQHDFESDWSWELLDSYSILDLVELKWIVCDQPYPEHVGSLGYYLNIYVPPCFGGNKVLICRSKIEDDTILNLSPADMFIFNTKTFAFSNMSTQIVGEIPPLLKSYTITPFRGLTSESKFILFGASRDDNNGPELWSFDMLTDSWTNLKLSEELGKLQMQYRLAEYVPSKGCCILGYRELVPRRMDQESSNSDAEASKPWNTWAMIN